MPCHLASLGRPRRYMHGRRMHAPRSRPAPPRHRLCAAAAPPSLASSVALGSATSSSTSSRPPLSHALRPLPPPALTPHSPSSPHLSFLCRAMTELLPPRRRRSVSRNRTHARRVAASACMRRAALLPSAHTKLPLPPGPRPCGHHAQGHLLVSVAPPRRAVCMPAVAHHRAAAPCVRHAGADAAGQHRAMPRLDHCRAASGCRRAPGHLASAAATTPGCSRLLACCMLL